MEEGNTVLRCLQTNQGYPGISITRPSTALRLAHVQAGLVGKVLTPARWSHSKVPEDRACSVAGKSQGMGGFQPHGGGG